MGEELRSWLKAVEPDHDKPLTQLLARRLLAATRSRTGASFAHEGQRYVVARIRDPKAPGIFLPELSERERHVVVLLALGSSLKQIHYEYGLAVTTIHATAQRAARKLGAPGRAALIRQVHAAVDALFLPPLEAI